VDHFKGWEGEDYDRWADVIRVHPKPPKTFSSYRIPRAVTESLAEADTTLQVGAHRASCVMFGRALEGVCRDVLETDSSAALIKKNMMLGAGLKLLKEKNIIDQRLFDWSQQLQAFRNLAAHSEDTPISREDTEDLQAFVYAITEYIYDLSERYEEFQARQAKREAAKAKGKGKPSPFGPG